MSFVKTIKNALKRSYLYNRVYRPMIKNKREAWRKQQSNYLREEGTDLLRRVYQAIQGSGANLWIEYGTLLGFFREHDFIAHDDDIDFGAVVQHQPLIRKALLDAGFKINHVYREVFSVGMEECYQFQHLTFDVFYFPDYDKEHYYDCVFIKKRQLIHRKRRPIKAIVKVKQHPKCGVSKAVFKGVDILIPSNVEDHLRNIYGPCFMTPDSRFKSSERIIYSYKENPGEMIGFD